MQQQRLDYGQQGKSSSSIGARPTEQSACPRVSARREAWRESVVLGRAKGPIRNRVAYLCKAMPQFVADEQHEVYQWLVGQLVEHIDAARPNVDRMKLFVKQAAEVHDLPLTDTSVECVVELAYFKWKAKVLASGEVAGTSAGN